MSFKWKCPGSNPVIILNWFLLKLSNSPALLAERILTKPSACLYPQMNCQYCWCLLLVQSVIMPMATFADIWRVDWGHVSGCGESSLASWWAVSFPSILMCPGTHTVWIPLCSAILLNPLNPELNPICYVLALLAHHFLHVSRIRVKSLTLRSLTLYIYGAPILDVSRSRTTTQHSR